MGFPCDKDIMISSHNMFLTHSGCCAGCKTREERRWMMPQWKAVTTPRQIPTPMAMMLTPQGLIEVPSAQEVDDTVLQQHTLKCQCWLAMYWPHRCSGRSMHVVGGSDGGICANEQTLLWWIRHPAMDWSQ